MGNTPVTQKSFDVVVCGGTLGILVARALQNQGFSVCIVERGVVQGRDQEWNVSCEELQPLVRHDIVSQDEVDKSVQSSWPNSRVGFESSSSDHAVNFRAGALNAGISPQKLVAAARKRFEDAGGEIIETTNLETLEVFDDAVLLQLKDKDPIRGRLVVDAMGSGSPIVSQARAGAPPDAACLVVGTMASGYDKEGNVDGDYLYSTAASGSLGHQGFWEAFPSANGGVDGTDRTTYYFTYVLPGEENLPNHPRRLWGVCWSIARLSTDFTGKVESEESSLCQFCCLQKFTFANTFWSHSSSWWCGWNPVPHYHLVALVPCAVTFPGWRLPSLKPWSMTCYLQMTWVKSIPTSPI